MTRPRILITGPGGRVGPHILPLLRSKFALRLFDLKPPTPEQDDEVVIGDIQDFAAIKDACAGITAMVHLAAISDEDDFYTRLLPVNLHGVYNAFEAAHAAGVKKMIYASTCQTVLNYSEGTWVTPEMPVRPYTVYACTKVFGEALGRYYSDQRHMSVICLRIGWFQGYDSPALRNTPQALKHWCSPRDLAQLIIKSVQTDLRFAVFFAVSNNTGRFWDITNAQQLVGYQPEDNSAALPP
jgi:nucleoside-diphosphate-sugar epimerase